MLTFKEWWETLPLDVEGFKITPFGSRINRTDSHAGWMAAIVAVETAEYQKSAVMTFAQWWDSLPMDEEGFKIHPFGSRIDKGFAYIAWQDAIDAMECAKREEK